MKTLRFTEATLYGLILEPMLRRQREVRRRVQQLVDAGIFTLAYWLAHSARSHLQFVFFWERPEIEPFNAYAWLIPVILLPYRCWWSKASTTDRFWPRDARPCGNSF